MESDIKQTPIILEFYGLPGCGKSTISHIVAEELRKKNKSVSEPTYDVDHKYSSHGRKIKKMLELLRYAVFHPYCLGKLIDLVNKNNYTGFDRITQIANIAYKLWIYNREKKEYVIFDEGLTQSAISLAMNGSGCGCVENERFLYGLCTEKNVHKFYIKVPIETALMRMEKREKHDSRIERIKEKEEQIKVLKVFEKKCEEISLGYTIFNKTKDESLKFVMARICQ